jgi:beta-mannosidase
LTSEVRELTTGWELASTPPDACLQPEALDRLEWMPARVPGTAAVALREAGLWRAGDGRDFDADDWWFRTRFEAEPAAEGEELRLVLGGIATVAEVYLNAERVLDSDSMFAAHAVDVTSRVRGETELAIRCRALAPLLGVRRRPRARWRTRLVAEGNLRFFRTMLLGRAPGFAPGPAAVGPWKPVGLERRRRLAVEELAMRPRVQNGGGILAVRGRLRPVMEGARIEAVAIEAAGARAELRLDSDPAGTVASGELVLAEAEPWWPHTHGRPTLHLARLLVRVDGEEVTLDAGPVGFRALETDGRVERDGLQLQINGVPVFARGAVWTPPDIAMPCSSAEEVDRVLGSVVAAGMNMLRVPGIGCYEGEAFYDRCDELGILVWQDFMFANLDYPEQDEAFMATIEREGRQVLDRLARRPCLAVLCGGSEVAQQVAMLGLDPRLASGPLYAGLLPSLVAESGTQAAYVPSTPWGGDLPFRPDKGVANYYGVGAYLRPLEDARRSEVRFAAECLAFANVPDDQALEAIEAPGGLVVHHPRWKAGVPRDAGTGWDFEDVRDHYLRELFGVDPVALRWTDHERYLELSRFATGEVMAEVFGEWRRAGSPCGGGLVLWLTDLMPGPGWGLLDHRGEPKVAYHHLRRALAPVAVWSSDEGLGGVVAHVANDRPNSLAAILRVALYREFEVSVDEASRDIRVGSHDCCSHNVEELLGRFVDAAWAYRFGPPAHDLIAMSLEQREADRVKVISQAFRMPAGRPLTRESPARLGLAARWCEVSDGAAAVAVFSRRFAYGVRVTVPGFAPEDDAFGIEPGHERVVVLRRVSGDAAPDRGSVSAVNLAGRVKIEPEPAP